MTEIESESSGSEHRPVHGDSTVVVAEYQSFNDLLGSCAGRISEEGLVVDSDTPAVVGSTVGFELRVRDGFAVLTGAGELVAAREKEASGATRIEMMLRFVHLDQPSLKLLPKLIEHYRKRGVALLELPSGAIVDSAVTEVEPEPLDAAAPVTLDDLEDEFSAPAETDGPEEEQESTPSSDLEVDAVTEPEAMLIEAEPAAAESATAEGPDTAAEKSDEIRVEDLMPDAEPEPGVLESPAELEGPPEDPGLPWLPDESEAKKRSDWWLILLLAVVGALLGAGFYYLYLSRSGESGSEQVDPEGEVLAASTDEAGTATGPTDVLPVTASVATESPGVPLTRIDRITWDASDRETVVVLWADGDFAKDRFRAHRVEEDPPREVVKIIGISQPFSETSLILGTDHVRRLRTALHTEVEVQELHVVADLVDPAVELSKTEVDGIQLRVFFSRS